MRCWWPWRLATAACSQRAAARDPTREHTHWSHPSQVVVTSRRISLMCMQIVQVNVRVESSRASLTASRSTSLLTNIPRPHAPKRLKLLCRYYAEVLIVTPEPPLVGPGSRGRIRAASVLRSRAACCSCWKRSCSVWPGGGCHVVGRGCHACCRARSLWGRRWPLAPELASELASGTAGSCGRTGTLTGTPPSLEGVGRTGRACSSTCGSILNRSGRCQ